MHRTQISLEEEQYRKLRLYAQKRHRSISAILRDLLDEHVPDIEPEEDEPTPLQALKGIVSGNGKTAGKDHNDSLYRHEKRWNEEQT